MIDAVPEQSLKELEALRRAALATAASIRAIQQRKDEELLEAKHALEQRTAELAESVAILAATLESFPDGIVAYDLHRRHINCNKRFASIWNIPDTFLANHDGPAIAAHIASQLQDKERYLERMRAHRENPETPAVDEFELVDGRTFERHAAPQLRNGSCVGIVANWREITERKRAEADRLALESQLRERQKMESLGTLAGGVAHDFNNILGSVLGNAALLREELRDQPIPASALTSLGEIERSGIRGRDLVRRILAFSRQQPQEFQTLALQPLVEESVALMRSTLPAYAQLHASYNNGPMYVFGHSTQIAQIVMNLCSNAWQALEGRPGRVDLTLDTCITPGANSGAGTAAPHARLRVTDTGKGMDAATQARIFDPFFTTKEDRQGTGLGLSMVHGIVAEHRGAIVVDSCVGGGATFEILLPLVDAPPLAADTLPAAPPQAISSNKVASRRVMYIDDDESMNFLVTRLLERRGCRVSAFLDAGQALEALRANPADCDLLVTDYNMPRLSGIDVAIAAASIRPDLPVVLISGYITDGTREAARVAGIRHLIEKAHTAEELCATLERIVNAQSG